MNRKLIAALSLAVACVIAISAWLSLRVAAAPSGPRTFLPLVQQSAPALSPLPDLAVAPVRYNMKGYTGACVPRYAALVLDVCIRNQGRGDAEPFAIAVRSYEAANAPGLAAGQVACLETAFAPSNPVDITVDPAGTVNESDESNNYWYNYVPVPTPLVLCTATPAPSPVATRTP